MICLGPPAAEMSSQPKSKKTMNQKDRVFGRHISPRKTVRPDRLAIEPKGIDIEGEFALIVLGMLMQGVNIRCLVYISFSCIVDGPSSRGRYLLPLGGRNSFDRK